MEENNLNKDLSDFFGGFNAGEIVTKEDPAKTLTDEEIEELTKGSEEKIEEEDSATSEEEDDTTENSDDTEETEEEKSEEKEDIEYSYKAFANYLSDQGIIDYEDSDDIEDTPEILEEAVMNTAKNMLQEYKESLPEDGRLFLDYIEKGGDPSKFFSTYEKGFDIEKINLDDDLDQKRVIKEFLELQGYTGEEIEEEIKDYEDALILGKKAKTAFNKVKDHLNKEKERIVQEQEKQLALQQEEAEKYIENVKTFIASSNTLGGLAIDNKDKKAFEDYLLKRDREGYTEYEKDLSANPLQTQIELAYLKFKNYDFSKVASKVKTEETKRIRNLIKNKDTSPKGGTRFEDNKDSLAAFKETLRTN